MLYVIATVNLRPGCRERFLEELRTVAAEVRRESGCQEYRVAVDVASGLARQIEPRPDTVTIVEGWADLPSLQTHSTAPHMQSFRQRSGELVVATILQVLAPVVE
jgi:quinol monooxygenase YgiN